MRGIRLQFEGESEGARGATSPLSVIDPHQSQPLLDALPRVSRLRRRGESRAKLALETESRRTRVDLDPVTAREQPIPQKKFLTLK